MRNNPDAAITVDDLSVVRGGTEVIRGIELTVPRGAIVGLLGPSGSGKTTLMRSIVGAQIISGGSITVLGLPAGHAQLRHKVGYVTQAPSVYPDLTVTQNLAYFAKLVGAPKAHVPEVIETVGLSHLAAQLTSKVSGGELSRVSLGAALVGDPELLILDEPTVGLDPVLRNDLWGTFRSLADSGTTLLVSSHVMDEARRCDRLVFMRGGRVLANDTLENIGRTTNTNDAESAFLALASQGDPE